MGTNYLPSTDDGLAQWGTAASAKLTATPTAFGVNAAMATQLASLLATFVSTLAASKDPATSGPAKTLAKRESKNAFVAYARMVVRQVQGTATVTDAQRQSLGITVRKAIVGPILPPTSAPRIVATAKAGRIVGLVLSDADVTNKRARPAGATGATIFSNVGSIPAQMSDWTYEGQTSQRSPQLQFDAALPIGTVVYITAFWYCPTGLSGPAATPISVELIGGGVVKQTASRPMKLAA